MALTPGEMGITPVTVEEFSAYIEKNQRLANNWGRLLYDSNGHVQSIMWENSETVEQQLRGEFNEDTPPISISSLRKLIPTMQEYKGRFALLRDGGAQFLKPDHPAVMVDWYEAAAYAFLLGGRLPTEAEWECAARAGREGDDVYGTDTGKLTPQNAHWNHNGRIKITARVKSYPPNPWGLYDMSGNVQEWVHNWYVSAYTGTDTGLPTVNPAGPIEGETRVLRGGWFSNTGDVLGVSYRFHEHPHRYSATIGFRVFSPIHSHLSH